MHIKREFTPTGHFALKLSIQLSEPGMHPVKFIKLIWEFRPYVAVQVINPFCALFIYCLFALLFFCFVFFLCHARCCLAESDLSSGWRWLTELVKSPVWKTCNSLAGVSQHTEGNRMLLLSLTTGSDTKPVWLLLEGASLTQWSFKKKS